MNGSCRCRDNQQEARAARQGLFGRRPTLPFITLWSRARVQCLYKQLLSLAANKAALHFRKRIQDLSLLGHAHRRPLQGGRLGFRHVQELRKKTRPFNFSVLLPAVIYCGLQLITQRALCVLGRGQSTTSEKW